MSHVILLMTLTGKTGYRKSATMNAAVDIFEKQKIDARQR